MKPEPLQRFLDENLPNGSIAAVRLIRADDERLLTPMEAQGMERAVARVRRASGAGRGLARTLCGQLGVPVTEIPRSSRRYPVWPSGLVGSITHDDEFAAVVVGPSATFRGIGIDIEPAEELPSGLPNALGTAGELADFSDLPFGEKVLFSIKEAVFKAVFPRDGIFLEFHNVTVSRPARTASTCYGRTVHWRILNFPRVLAIAWW
jgi:4'-phosphopantetheinyl transferase EntD